MAETWISKLKVKLGKAAIDKGEGFDDKHSWTIHFLVDLKVVYIITYAYITIVNLISSTANSEATSDADSMMEFDVSSQYKNAVVSSISDAVLWNCRRLSVTDYYYKFLYWMLLVAMVVALVGFLVTKFISLIVVSCGCMKCRPLQLTKYGLTKLWHIAILEQIKEICACAVNADSKQPSTRADTNPPISDRPSAIEAAGSEGITVTVAEVNVVTEINSKEPNEVSSNENNERGTTEQNATLTTTQNQETEIEIVAPEIDQTTENSINQCSNEEISAIENETSTNLRNKTANNATPSRLKLKDYEPLLSEKIPKRIVEKFSSTYMNCSRTVIPNILPWLLVITMGLSFLSYDLHPLACIVEPAEEFFKYNQTSKRVEIEFSENLIYFQKTAGFIVFVIVDLFLVLVILFSCTSKKVSAGMKWEARDYINVWHSQIQADKQKEQIERQTEEQIERQMENQIEDRVSLQPVQEM